MGVVTKAAGADGAEDVEPRDIGPRALIEPLAAGTFPGQRSRGSQAIAFRRRLHAEEDLCRLGRGGAGGQGRWGAGDRSRALVLLLLWPGISGSWRESRWGLAAPRVRSPDGSRYWAGLTRGLPAGRRRISSARRRRRAASQTCSAVPAGG